jgi:hypothetical protein
MVRHDVNQETGNPGALTEALRLIRERSVWLTGDSLSGDPSVLILPAAEPDGICSSHILTSILKLEGIAYTLQPVHAYSDLQTAIETLRPSVRTVVMLNCGAVVNLVEFLANIADTVLIVIDSHRPIHLKNVTEPARILVLDDDLGRGGYFPSEAMLLEDSEATDGDVIDNLFLDDEDGDNGGDPHAKRQRTGDAQRKKILREYYEGYYYASPTALVLYTLAADMGYQSQQMLWLAVVGLASYVESGYFSLDTFRGIAQDVDNHYISSSSSGSGQVRFVEDLRLPMYRHWSLLEAMTHSPYVYAELKLYRDHGHGTMQKLLVYAGLAPSNYKQTFSSMSLGARKLVAGDQFKRRCAHYGLEELKHYQFVRSLRLKDEERPSLSLNELTASDVYYMISASLQMKGFGFAMDVAVNTAPLTEMHAVITRALEVHKDIVAQAKMIIDKRAWRLVDGGLFRFAVVDSPLSPIFHSTPHTARWLAMFLMTVLQYRNRSSPIAPLLLCVKKASEGSYLCIGADPQDTKSEFVFRFRNACDATAVRIQLNSFDFALAEVPVADFQTWSQALLGGDSGGMEDDGDDTDDDEEEDEQVVDQQQQDDDDGDLQDEEGIEDDQSPIAA